MVAKLFWLLFSHVALRLPGLLWSGL